MEALDSDRGVLLQVMAGIGQRRITGINKTDCVHLRQILTGMPLYGGQHMTKDYVGSLLGLVGTYPVDDLFRRAGEEPVRFRPGKRSAGITLGTD